MTHDSLESILKWKSNWNNISKLEFHLSYEIKEVTKFHLGIVFFKNSLFFFINESHFTIYSIHLHKKFVKKTLIKLYMKMENLISLTLL